MLIPSEQDFAAAVALWREWNSRINVISRKDEESIFAHHILHSLAIAQYLETFYTVIPSEAKETILDVGCGGGFPGIPLAMVMPETKFTLCDSIGKKVKVAQAVADGLGLQNVECVNARVETLKGEWDWVVSRAVTSLENFYPWVKGRFRKSILYLKGGDINVEIAALQHKYHIPNENIRTWRVDSWIKDEYFAEKFVIEIGKNYLCTP
ncbi:MAG: 16S rRNA (guanine(527)-N(7))-methyltransferase RsmG [Bacteroidales bacterium]|nr:16S rRNA (guanine(527)-N(7))-methyltransferase RsmG [Bacteroidales bacterium]